MAEPEEPITLTAEQVQRLYAAVPPPAIVEYVEQTRVADVDLVDLLPWLIRHQQRNLEACAELVVDAQDKARDARALAESRSIAANDAVEQMQRYRTEAKTHRSWETRLVATLAAQDPSKPYSRAMIDSVMRDCPVKVQS